MDKKRIEKKDFTYDYQDINVGYHYRRTNWEAEHCHVYWEVILMCRGSTTQVINDRAYVISENELMLIKPDDRHYFTSKKQGFLLLSLGIRDFYFKQILDLIDAGLFEKFQTAESRIIGVAKETAVRWNKELYKDQTAHTGGSKSSGEILHRLVLNIISEICMSVEFSEKKDTLITRVLACMEDSGNIGKRFKDICRIMHYNETYIIRLFKENDMPTPNSMFKDIKLNYAKGLLVSTNYSTNEISEKIGYISSGYFNKVFKLKYGLTPGSYRKRHKKW